VELPHPLPRLTFAFAEDPQPAFPGTRDSEKSQRRTSKTKVAPSFNRMEPPSSLDALLFSGPQAPARFGSSTIEKRTPALCRFSSDTSRQASSASLRVLNGP